jgi:hypothetical protein
MLSFVPRAVESEFISVPVTMGALRSVILLPADWREWDDAKLDAVVAHEVSHVARRDAFTQRLALLHRTISGSVRSHGGSTGVLPTLLNKPATKRPCPRAPTVSFTT